MHNRWYGAKHLHAIWAWGRNAGNFSGRSSRSEYWWMWLFGYLLSLMLNFVVIVQGEAIYTSANLRQMLIVTLIAIIVVTILPSTALQIRRLRDAGIDWRKGVAVMLIEAVMAIGFILLHGVIGKLALVGLLASGALLLWWSYQQHRLVDFFLQAVCVCGTLVTHCLKKNGGVMHWQIDQFGCAMHQVQPAIFISEMPGRHCSTIFSHVITMGRWYFALKIPIKNGTLQMVKKSQIENLHWLGIDWDEGPDKGGDFGPYRQSERKDIYMKYINQLLAEGKAYESYKTEEELQADREAQQANHEMPHYVYEYEGLTEAEKQAKIDAAKAKGLTPVIRFHIPADKTYEWQDIVKGDISIDGNTIGGDFVILKRDACQLTTLPWLSTII